MIDVADVRRSFIVHGRTIQALRGLDLHIRQGACVVMMGPSGSGKTTLLNIIGGLDQPTAGTVTIAGQCLQSLSAQRLTALRRQIGFVFQHSALIPTASAYENVELALRIAGGLTRHERASRVRRCLEVVGVLAWANHRPYEMSGGQQQRVAIARALAIRPHIILADEPTGDLDSTTGRHILTLLRTLADHEQITCLIATHDPAAAAFASDHYHLHDGSLVAHTRSSDIGIT